MARNNAGRPRIRSEIEDVVVRLGREISGWGYDRTVGALANLRDSAPPRDRATTGEKQNDHLEEFIRRHLGVLAGTDFFTVEVLTWRGLVTYYVLFFIHLEGRRVSSAGITAHRISAGCAKWVATRHWSSRGI